MCMYCNCKTEIESTTTHVVTLENCIIIVKKVPCIECEQCGEKYYTDEVMEILDEIVIQAKKLATEVFITEFHSNAA